MNAKDFKIIHAQVWNPNNSTFFKTKANERAECKTYHCQIPEQCPLLPLRQCINATFLGPKCPYGFIRNDIGPTKKSRKCSEWASEQKAKYSDVVTKVSGSPPNKMINVGEYIYLPYAHMDMNTGVPFLGHSHVFISGSPFILFTNFTVEVIKKIVDFHPHALMGGEITCYQKEQVPMFLTHLREVFPDLYNKFIGEFPVHAIEQRNCIGRTALLNTINVGEVIIRDRRWKWNGTTLQSFDEKLVLFSGIEDRNGTSTIESLVIEVIPTKDAIVKITSNDQVNNNTVFID